MENFLRYLVQGIFEDDLVLDGLHESHDLAAFELGFLQVAVLVFLLDDDFWL